MGNQRCPLLIWGLWHQSPLGLAHRPGGCGSWISTVQPSAQVPPVRARSSGLGTRMSLPPSPQERLVTESQNSRGWKGPLWVV